MLAREEARRALAVLGTRLGERAPDAFYAFCVAVNRGSLPSDERTAMAQGLGGSLRNGDAATIDAFEACARRLLELDMHPDERTQTAVELLSSCRLNNE